MNRLESLKIFISVAKTLHFRETAQHLAVSPQVITRTISKLEKELITYVYRPPRIRFVFDTLAEILERKLAI